MKGKPKPHEELRECLERFHDVSLERVLGEIEYLRDQGDTVIAGGSLVYGLGNHLSDLDLVITGSTTVESSRVPLEHFINSLRVDVWKLAQTLIEDSFDRAERALAADVPLLGSFGDTEHDDELKLLHRVAFGVIIDGDGIEPHGRDYATVASDVVVREYIERMRTSALLAQLALTAGQSIAAAINARLTVEDALNAVIAFRGLPFSGGKWLGERLANQASDLAHIYEPFRLLPKNPHREVTQFVRGALRACGEMWGLDLGLDTMVSAVEWTSRDLRVAEIGTDRLLLSPSFGALWNLDKKEIEVWRQLSSSESEGNTTWALSECNAEALAMCLHLHEQGLADLHWIKGVPIGNLRPALDTDIIT